MTSSEKNKGGRPVEPVDWEKANIVLQQLKDGKSLRKACEAIGMTKQTIWNWMEKDDKFADQYARCRIIGYSSMAEDLTEISDGDSVIEIDGKTFAPDPQRDRLRVDTRKWILSKMLPKIYGDKQLVELANKEGETLKIEQSPDQIARSIAFALAAGLRSRDMGNVVEVDKPKLEDGTND